MERRNDWNDQNTTALIQGISGIAGNIINKNNQGGQISAQEKQVALLAQQTAAALGQAQYTNPTPAPNAGLSSPTVLVIGGVLLLVIGYMLFKR